MDQVATGYRVLLSQSFRFGDAIASAATAVIRRIGAKEPVRGISSISSHLARVRPDAILCRSNAGVIGNVLACVARGVTCHVLGGTRELERVLEDVQRVKQGSVAHSAELLGFAAWKDVMTFAGKPEGEHLRSLVTLVQEYGEGTMLRALARCEGEESTAQVVCSTAHKAKGREWSHVRVDPDFDSGLLRAAQTSPGRSREQRKTSFEAEARLLYVALTRAKIAVHLPRAVMQRFGLTRTTEEVVGTARTTHPQAPDGSAGISAKEHPEVVSPYHSPQSGDSREMAALRRHLR